MARQNPLGIAIAWALLVASVHGQSDVLAEVPQHALGVIAVHRISTTNENFQKLARELQAPFGSPLDMIKSITGVRTGVDEKGSAAFVALPGSDPDGPPTAALLIPVTDYQAVVDQLKGDDTEEITEVQVGHALVARKGNYAVIAQPGNRAAVRQILDAKMSLAEGFPAELGKWQNEFGVVMIATPAGIKKVSSSAIIEMERAKVLFPPDRDETRVISQAFDLYAEMFRSISESAKYFAVGGRVDGDGALHISSRTLLKMDAATVRKFEKAGSPTELLSGLPAQKSLFAFAGPLSEEWITGSNLFSVKAMKMNPLFSKLDEEQTKRLHAALSGSMHGLESFGIVVGSGGEIESLYERVSGIMKVNDAGAFMKNYKHSIDKMDELLTEVGDGSTRLYEVSDMQIEGKPAILIRMDAKAMMAGNPVAANPITEKLFGPEGKLDAYIAPADDKTVLMAYMSEAAIKKVIAAYRSSKANPVTDPLISETAALLPEGAQWVGFLSPAGMLEFVRKTMSTIVPQGRQITIPDFPESPPLGFAVKLSSTALDTDFVIPHSVLKATGNYVQKVRNAQ
jgi:hypothetical protein